MSYLNVVRYSNGLVLRVRSDNNKMSMTIFECGDRYENRVLLLQIAQSGCESLFITCPKHGIQFITRMYSTVGSCPKCKGKDLK